jgi:hypothetical protein
MDMHNLSRIKHLPGRIRGNNGLHNRPFLLLSLEDRTANVPSQTGGPNTAHLLCSPDVHGRDDKLAEKSKLLSCFAVNLFDFLDAGGFVDCYDVPVAVSLSGWVEAEVIQIGGLGTSGLACVFHLSLAWVYNLSLCSTSAMTRGGNIICFGFCSRRSMQANHPAGIADLVRKVSPLCTT